VLRINDYLNVEPRAGCAITALGAPRNGRADFGSDALPSKLCREIKCGLAICALALEVVAPNALGASDYARGDMSSPYDA